MVPELVEGQFLHHLAANQVYLYHEIETSPRRKGECVEQEHVDGSVRNSMRGNWR